LQARAQLFDITLAVGTAFVEDRRDVAVFIRVEVSEREVFQLPFELPDAEAICQRREYSARFDCETLAFFSRQLPRVPQPNQLLGQSCEHESRVAHDSQKHFAQRLCLSRIEPLDGRPIARQPQLAQAHEGQRNVRYRGTDQAREFLWRDAGQTHRGFRKNRCRQHRVVRQCAHDLGGLGTEGQPVMRDQSRCLDGGPGERYRFTNGQRTELDGLHGSIGKMAYGLGFRRHFSEHRLRFRRLRAPGKRRDFCRLR